tara:strand:+ start:2417 stop:2878 length:462 start_codon:yes stop_codon:yes gene_type:complete
MVTTFLGNSNTEEQTTTSEKESSAMTLKEMLMADGYTEMTFSILRRIAKTPREELILGLMHKDMHVNRDKKSYESTSILDQLQDRVLIELYAENIVMGSGWVSFEPEDGQSYADVTSIWKVSAKKQAQWDAEDAKREAIMNWDDDEDWEWEDE